MVDVWISTSAKGTILFALPERFARIDLEDISVKQKITAWAGIK